MMSKETIVTIFQGIGTCRRFEFLGSYMNEVLENLYIFKPPKYSTPSNKTAIK